MTQITRLKLSCAICILSHELCKKSLDSVQKVPYNIALMADVPASKKFSDRDYYFFALRIIGDFGVSIAAPVVLLAMVGQRLDEKWGTGPYVLIAGFVLAAVCSGVIVYRKAKRYGEEYKKLNNSSTHST